MEARPVPPALRTALAAAWTALVVVLAAPAFRAHLAFARDSLSAVSLVPSVRVLAANWAGIAATVAVAGILCAVLWLAGLRLLRWMDPGPRPGAGIRMLSAFPVGVAGASFLLLGLLLVRLWFPAVLACAFAALVAVARPCAPRPKATGTVVPAGPGFGWAVLAFALWIPWLLVPETHEDAWTYHLAAPRRWLDLHGLALAHCDVSHHFPLAVEVVYALPLALSLDSVPKWLNTAAFLSGIGAVVTALRLPRPAFAWIVLAGAANTGVIPTAKSDGFTTGAILTAFAWALASSRRAGVLSPAVPAGLLAGIALAAKNTAVLNILWIPAAVAAITGSLRPRRVLLWAAAAALPILPWLAKSWIMTGNPLYPGTGMILALVPTADLWRAPAAALRSLAGESLAVAWIAPAALVAARPALFPLAIYGLWFVAFPTVHTPRFAFPAFAATACLLLRATPVTDTITGPGWRRYAFILLASVAVLNRTAGAFGSGGLTPNPLPYVVGAETKAAHVFRGLTGVEEARRYLEANRMPGSVLLVSEWHQYGMPQPCYEASPDLRKPASLPWEIVRASSSEAGVLRRLRQLRVTRIAYNPVRALNAAHMPPPVPWTDSQLRLWHSFFRRHAVLEHASDNLDFRQGALYVYRLVRAPAPRPLAPLHLPGVETLFGSALALEYAGDHEGAFASARSAYQRMPPVLGYADTVGILAFQARRYDEAMRFLKPSVDRDFVDGENLFLYGMSAYLTGRYREAAAVLPRAAVANPHRAATAFKYAEDSRRALKR